MNTIHIIKTGDWEGAAALYMAAATVFQLPLLEGLVNRRPGYQPEWVEDEYCGPMVFVAESEDQDGDKYRKILIETSYSHRLVKTEWREKGGRWDLTNCELIFPGGSERAAGRVVEALLGRDDLWILRGPRAKEREVPAPMR